MPLIDHLFAFAPVRKLIWKLWYPYVTRRLRGDEVLFLNYSFEPSEAMNLPLSSADSVNRTCIQLYHHVATQEELRGRQVLEVSCGHGGGASYLCRTLAPSSYTALDLNPTGIQFCQQRHQVPGLSFVVGDAENLPFPDHTFDAIVNVEASHCYPHFARFLSEVARVLKPGGFFLYTDFRFPGGIADWERDIAAAPLQLVRQRVINAEVIRGLDVNSARSITLIEQNLPKFLHSLGRDFAGVAGSRIYQALKDGSVSYRSFTFRKA